MSKITTVLNELIETSKDGDKGFRKAAEETSTPELKEIFLKRAEDCAKGAAQLQRLVASHGGKPEDSGTMAGTAFRGWMNLKSAMPGRDDAGILEDCERGEDVAKAKYRQALDDSSLTPEARSVVQKQYDGVIRNHDQIRALRERYRLNPT